MKNLTFFFSLFAILSVTTIRTQNLYDINSITVIELTFEEINWDEILTQYHLNGQGERLIANAVVNGIVFDSVGVRYKGHSTFHPHDSKKPMNIKLDYIKKQDYQGFETLKLSNGKQDPSFVREVLSYEIARKYMVAPLSNYAKVFINGYYHGLYSSTESINGDFGRRYLFADENSARFKCNPQSLAEGAGLNFIGMDSTAYFGSYELKSDYGWIDLVNLIDVLNNNPSSIEALMNVDRAIWMLAFDNVLVNLDSYIGPFRQNYYLLENYEGVFNTILWDMNECLGGFERVGAPQGPPHLSDLISLAPDYHNGIGYPLLQLVLGNDTYRKMYIAHCRTILDENLSNGWYETRGDELQSIIANAVQTDPHAIYNYDQFIINLTDFVPSVGGPGGIPGAFGITQLFEPRVNFLENNIEYQSAPPLITNILISPGSVPENTSVTITAKVENANSLVLGYRSSGDDRFTKVVMVDDGNHGDGIAGDNIFGIQIQVGVADIQYYFYAENAGAGVFSPERAEHEFYEMEVIAEVSDIVINEFMANNTTTVMDQDGEFDDWIELFNNTNVQISLTGYFLSDDMDNLAKWAFPDTIIEEGGYLIVWADKDIDQIGLHASFKLSKSGEGIFLSNNETVVDQVIFGMQTEDITFGRYPNGTGDFTEMPPSYYSENRVATAIPVVERLSFRMYPNPASNWVRFDFSKMGSFLFQIYNSLGKECLSGVVSKGEPVFIANLHEGVYFLKIENSVVRLVVLR